jgi:Fe-S cluster biosynthesis and repair protein YggX
MQKNLEFRKYMHIERWGSEAVQNIELGTCYVFPKLDGTNSSIWCNTDHDDGGPGIVIHAGSRTREISLEKDNAGFFREYVLWKEGLDHFFKAKPHLRLYGEWLVPHSFKGYREDAWRKFYVFDVYNEDTGAYLDYSTYSTILEYYGIAYIPPMQVVKNSTYENFVRCVENNKFLCPTLGEPGEGVVIKNYEFFNKFGDQVWAKIVRQEFKELNHKTFGAPEMNCGLMNEELIVTKLVTSWEVDKAIYKVLNDHEDCQHQWSSKFIPELLGRVFHDVVEDLWDAWKEIKFATINGMTLKTCVIKKIKQLKPELF